MANRSTSPTDLSRPGGVVIDIRRAFIDKGNWQVETPFGLAYYALPSTATAD